MTILPDFDLTRLTTFHVPASTRWFAEYDNLDEFKEILSDGRFAGLPKMHIGGGSNLLFTKPFEGVVLHSAMKAVRREDISDTEAILRAEAGMEWDCLVRLSIAEGLYGLENLAYIPGEVGASAVQNVGAYGVEAKDRIYSVETIDTATGLPRTFSPEECRYGYRDSLFKHTCGRYIVTAVSYKLSKTPVFTLDYGPLRELAADKDLNAQKVYDRVVKIRKEKLPEPSQLGSAGSFFKNPVVPEEIFSSLKARHPEIPHYEAPAGVKIPAGWLIEHAGLKGFRKGGAEVYPKQCLVIVNTGDASASDVVDLFYHIKTVVLDKYGVELHPEVNVI
ncbi:MAG: UDP-N-acetylmuramate dehydrogenase [Muribaculum sp.]|nr:UDP-N-acetylmuramate dehydrogenase [Muribaculum sp.]